MKNTMTSSNPYFNTLKAEAEAFSKAQEEREAQKKQLITTKGWDSPEMSAWYEREKGFQFPLNGGQTSAYRAWAESVSYKADTLEVDDLPWDKDAHDFVEALRAAGITEFIVTDQSTALMRLLHLLTAEGCTMEGLCKAKRVELDWDDQEKVTEREGIRFRV